VSYRPRPGDRDDTAGRQQPPGWYVDPRSHLDPTGQQVLRWWDGTHWGEQTRPMPGRGQQPPIAYPQQPWPRRHKVLTVLGCVAVLIIVIGGMASLGDKAKQADNASTVATTTPARTATPSRTPTHHAVSAKAMPEKAPVTAQAAAPAPVATVHAVTSSPPASAAPATCYPVSDEDTCYQPGEYCRDDNHGMSGVAGDGEAITCEDNHGWRWEPT
jgi:hypothetical protein